MNETRALRDVVAERTRQRAEEGWTEKHDDAHTDGSLARAAACYILTDDWPGPGIPDSVHRHWPRSWSWSWYKPKDRRRDLVRAGALILAEIERLDREEQRKKEKRA